MFQVFTAGDLEQLLFCGLIAVAAFNGLGLLKLWFFLEMNLERDRNWTARELKRLEIALTSDRLNAAADLK
ncbi:DUF6768 family protein [Wenzhouxiangella marina]|uniref:Uncharacterized protein n=1 Tax=Wenzhouxiangella marina TaxID=1579979 RepID=A0A0K0XRY1_9GAMM|nr:DUF6768 family protein [Wenzhouxiangella marina]AKS40469.1 hypothetical protein WM2015_78 [Wenzhouxiangella marina]MBB6088209.1 hypothetical protein [Wenzhouxiangella marina]